ncbi:hypothetical protein [Neogemmobacter tilapiae]|uniref:hypothetical protein n=1 Tax=Neogemmobacter tilapiae TaxID=875041 RepID=UPI0016788E1F|nr:hypothetical protein [Gemmobacter tilapiae]
MQWFWIALKLWPILLIVILAAFFIWLARPKKLKATDLNELGSTSSAGDSVGSD